MTKPHRSHLMVQGECQYCKASKASPYDMLKLLSPCKNVPEGAVMEDPNGDNDSMLFPELEYA